MVECVGASLAYKTNVVDDLMWKGEPQSRGESMDIYASGVVANEVADEGVNGISATLVCGSSCEPLLLSY